MLIIFLHDNPLEANPGGVLSAIGHLVPSIFGLCLTTGTIVGSAVAAFAASFLLRPQLFSLYIGASLACWMLSAWTSIVVMHTLGSYYEAHWQPSHPTRSRPRQGPATGPPSSKNLATPA